MNYYFDQQENQRVAEARDSFSGRILTNAQFDEAIAITGIIEREIRKTGAFKEKLSDYAYAFARTERFDVAKAETILRDLFKARTGVSMNQMREELAEREAKLTIDQKVRAHEFAYAVGNMIEHGDKISFNRALAHQGEMLAQELGITDAAAKRLMKEEFKANTDLDFYEWGKNLEEIYYHPQIDAEKQRAEERRQEGASSQGEARSRTNGRTRTPSRSSGQQEDAGGSRASGSYRRAAQAGGQEQASQDMSFEQPAQRTSQATAPARSRMRLSR